MHLDIPGIRLRSLMLSARPASSPEAIVRHLGALQAQDYAGALLSIALRMASPDLKAVKMAINERKIVRTWPMRGTLHFAAAEDVHWMLRLMAPRVIVAMVNRMGMLGLTADDISRCEKVIVRELSGGQQLSRETIYARLAADGIEINSRRGYHILCRLAHERVICYAAYNDNEPSIGLLDEWIPQTEEFDRDKSLAEIAARYFISHGPATVDDFVRWTNLTAADARAGLAQAAHRLISVKDGKKTWWLSPDFASERAADPAVYLLPGFDEYILGYKDKDHILDPAFAKATCPGSNGIFMPTVVIDGQVRGTWKSAIKRGKTSIITFPFDSFTPTDIDRISFAAEQLEKINRL